MFGAGLSLDQAPPFRVPYRFFISAPLFGIMAALLFSLLSGGDHRLAPEVIVAVHMLTIGVFLMVMTGAMMQMLPVIAGAVIPNPKRHGAVIHLLYTVGVLLLGAGLYFGMMAATASGGVLLGVGVLYFLILALGNLRRVRPFSDSVRAFVYALSSLGVAVGLGVLAALYYAGVGDYREIVGQLHLIWIFFGWIGLLVIGVSFQVVPMFYVAEAYPRFCRTWGTALIFASLLLVTLVRCLFPEQTLITKLAALPMVLLYIGFAVITIRRLRLRKRASKDATLFFWYLAMGSLGVALSLWYVSWLVEWSFGMESAGMVLGYGFVLGLISGMLYKIIPFLVWFHLNAKGHFDIPTMREMIPAKHIRMHFYLYLLGGSGLFAGWWGLVPTVVGGALLALSFGWWFWLLLGVGRYYFKQEKRPSPMAMMNLAQ